MLRGVRLTWPHSSVATLSPVLAASMRNNKAGFRGGCLVNFIGIGEFNTMEDPKQITFLSVLKS
jgi:hypothetical protein